MSTNDKGTVLLGGRVTSEEIHDALNKQAQDALDAHNEHLQNQIDAIVVKVNHMNTEWIQAMMHIAAANGDMKHYKRLEAKLATVTKPAKE